MQAMYAPTASGVRSSPKPTELEAAIQHIQAEIRHWQTHPEASPEELDLGLCGCYMPSHPGCDEMVKELEAEMVRLIRAERVRTND
jgi:hypothetical protein